jgi:hypothetical protein
VLLYYAKVKHQFIPSTSYYSQDFKIAFQEKDMDVIALGNSKLLSAINKNILEENKRNKVAVLGYSSANISISKLTLESYLDTCIKPPKLVLLEVSWFTFNSKRTHFHSMVGDLFVNDPKLWKHYFEYSDDLAFDIKRAFSYSLNLKTTTRQNRKNLSYANYFKTKSPQTKDYTFHLADMEVLFPNHVAGVDEKLLKDYKEIVNMCEEHEITLILFTSPEDETYTKNQKDIHKIKAVFDVSSRNNPNVIYLDYTFGGKLWNKNYEFWLRDSHHINENDLFSKRLLYDIKIKTDNKGYFKD